MIVHDIPVDADLFVYMNRPVFVPVKYKHVKRGTYYMVVSEDEIILNTFSEEGSFHDYPYGGRMVKCEFQYSGGEADHTGRVARYAGPIVVYVGEDGKFWMRPKFEFHDGRFERVVD